MGDVYDQAAEQVLELASVRGYLRKLKSGKVVKVGDHQNSKPTPEKRFAKSKYAKDVEPTSKKAGGLAPTKPKDGDSDEFQVGDTSYRKVGGKTWGIYKGDKFEAYVPEKHARETREAQRANKGFSDGPKKAAAAGGEKTIGRGASQLMGAKRDVEPTSKKAGGLAPTTPKGMEALAQQKKRRLRAEREARPLAYLSAADQAVHLAAAEILEDCDLAVKLASKGLLDRSPKSNWVEDNGGLPAAIEEMAHSIHTKRGKTISTSIAIAVSQAKKLAAKGDAKYVKAVAQWEALKAKSKIKKD